MAKKNPADESQDTITEQDQASALADTPKPKRGKKGKSVEEEYAFATPSGASGRGTIRIDGKEFEQDEMVQLVNLSPGVLLVPELKRDVVGLNPVTKEPIEGWKEVNEIAVGSGQPFNGLARNLNQPGKQTRWLPAVLFDPSCGKDHPWSVESAIGYFKRAISNPAFERAREDYQKAFKDYRPELMQYFMERHDAIEKDKQLRSMGA